MKTDHLLLWAALILALACSRQNNLLLGRVEAAVGTHTVVVTDCYRTSAPGPQQTEAAAYHYMPCRDADVWIRAEELSVNARVTDF
jgi:hypothetical protein